MKALLDQGAEVRALVREGKGDGGDALRDITDHDALSLVVGDLNDSSALLPHLDGVDVIVSAVQGNDDVVVGGQTNLLRAAEQAGVPRMIPSDFAVDLHRLDYGDNLFLDMRKRFDEAFSDSTVQPTYLLNGGFMDVTLAPFSASSISRPTPCPTGATAAALDDSAAGRKVSVAGDTLTAAELRTEIEKAIGRTLTARPLGSIEELEAEIERRKPIAKNPFEYVSLQYQWTMVTGKGKLQNLNNNDYPSITPTTVSQFIASHPF